MNEKSTAVPTPSVLFLFAMNNFKCIITMMTLKKPIGRPRLPLEEQQKYERIAVYPHTHQRIKTKAKAASMTMVDWLDKVTQ